VEYGAPQDRAKGSNNLAANIFLHFKKILEDFDLVKTVGTSKVVMEPAGVVGIFTPWQQRHNLGGDNVLQHFARSETNGPILAFNGICHATNTGSVNPNSSLLPLH